MFKSNKVAISQRGIEILSGGTNHTFLFFSEDIDLNKDIWKDGISYQNLSTGQMLTHLGCTEDNFLGSYTPTGATLEQTNTSLQMFTGSATNNFLAQKGTTPVCCIFLYYTNGNLTDLSWSELLPKLTYAVSGISLAVIKVSVGLRNSDAEMILLADEFTQGNRYRISDFKVDFSPDRVTIGE